MFKKVVFEKAVVGILSGLMLFGGLAPITAHAGKQSYVFYTENPGAIFTFEAEHQEENLSDYLGHTVTKFETNTANDFVSKWNSMDSNADTVVIYSHMQERAILFEPGADTNAITLNGKNRTGTAYVDAALNQLSQKNMATLALMGCNAGLVGVDNIAKCLIRNNITPNSTVYAFDGNCKFGCSLLRDNTGDYSCRLSGPQVGFNNLLKTHGINKRAPMGLIEYKIKSDGTMGCSVTSKTF